MIKTVRYLDAPNLIISIDIYDANDALISTSIMAESAVAGVYRKDVNITTTGDVWAIVRDENGKALAFEKLAPSVDVISIDVSEIHAVTVGDLDIVNGVMTLISNGVEVKYDLLRADGGVATSPAQAIGRVRI